MNKNHSTPTRQYGGINAAQRRAERRERFIAAGLEAFGVLGYNQATIKGICQLAELTERYFYESFANKEDLLCVVFRRLIEELEEGARRILETPGLSPEEAASRTLQGFYLLFLQDPRRARVQLFEVLGVSPRVDKEYRDSMKTLAAWIEESYITLFPGCDRNWLKQSIIPTGIAGAMVTIAHRWVLDGFQTPVNDIVNQSMEMFQAIGNYYRYKQNFPLS